MRIQTPARGGMCKHIQCFDALSFLKMNEQKPTWICPVCGKSSPFSNLIIDGYVDILIKTKQILPNYQHHKCLHK